MNTGDDVANLRRYHLINHPDAGNQLPGQRVKDQKLGLFCFLHRGVAKILRLHGLPVNLVQLLLLFEKAAVKKLINTTVTVDDQEVLKREINSLEEGVLKFPEAKGRRRPPKPKL